MISSPAGYSPVSRSRSPAPRTGGGRAERVHGSHGWSGASHASRSRSGRRAGVLDLVPLQASRCGRWRTVDGWPGCSAAARRASVLPQSGAVPFDPPPSAVIMSRAAPGSPYPSGGRPRERIVVHSEARDVVGQCPPTPSGRPPAADVVDTVQVHLSQLEVFEVVDLAAAGSPSGRHSRPRLELTHELLLLRVTR